MTAAEFVTRRAGELRVIAGADAVLEKIRSEILSIRPAHSEGRGDKLYAFVCGMDFFRLCIWAEENPHNVRHEFCRLIKRQKAGVKA